MEIASSVKPDRIELPLHATQFVAERLHQSGCSELPVDPSNATIAAALPDTLDDRFHFILSTTMIVHRRELL